MFFSPSSSDLLLLMSTWNHLKDTALILQSLDFSLSSSLLLLLMSSRNHTKNHTLTQMLF